MRKGLFSRSGGSVGQRAATGGASLCRRSFASVPRAPVYTRSHSAAHNGRYWWIVGAAGAAGVVGFASTRTTVRAESQPDWKEKIRGNYNNRIREFSTPEKVFSTFATIKKDGDYYMTIEDLCNAILPFDYRPDSERKRIKNIPEFILLADLDKDQLIDFSEYVFFVTLLGIPERHFKAAFHMFDTDGNGTVNKEEFKHVMRTLRSHSAFAQKQREDAEAVDNAGLFTLFFGADGSKELSYEQFVDFMRKLKRGVLSLEWQRYVGDESASMDLRNFGMSLVSYAHPKDVPHYLSRVDSLPRRAGASSAAPAGGISFQEFVEFNRALEHIEDIALAIKLYAHGGSLDRSAFKRAMKSLAGVNLTEQQLDVVFHVFDRDGDGRLDYDELMGVMQKRAYRGMAHPRDTGFTRFVDCLKQCWKRDASDDA